MNAQTISIVAAITNNETATELEKLATKLKLTPEQAIAKAVELTANVCDLTTPAHVPTRKLTQVPTATRTQATPKPSRKKKRKKRNSREAMVERLTKLGVKYAYNVVSCAQKGLAVEGKKYTISNVVEWVKQDTEAAELAGKVTYALYRLPNMEVKRGRGGNITLAFWHLFKGISGSTRRKEIETVLTAHFNNASSHALAFREELAELKRTESDDVHFHEATNRFLRVAAADV